MDRTLDAQVRRKLATIVPGIDNLVENAANQARPQYILEWEPPDAIPTFGAANGLVIMQNGLIALSVRSASQDIVDLADAIDTALFDGTGEDGVVGEYWNLQDVIWLGTEYYPNSSNPKRVEITFEARGVRR